MAYGEPREWTTSELFLFLQEKGVISDDAQFVNDYPDRSDMISQVESILEEEEDYEDI